MQKTANAEKLAEAGRKSWVTRRENELKRKRSEAGKKAAITRKANREARLQEEAKVAKKAARASKKASTVKAKSTTAKTKTSKAKRVVAKKTEALPLTKNQLLKLQRSEAAKKSWATRRKNAKK